MKITISPSEPQDTQTFQYYAVTIESLCDDSFTATQAVEMFYQAMLAFGHDSECVIRAMNEFSL
jgi:hypothetical protein